MALLTSLLSTLDKRGTAAVAGALGESESSVLRGMQSSIAAMLGGMASKADDPGALRTILGLAPSVPGGAMWSQLASSVSDTNSPLISDGKRVLSGLFGASESAVTSAVSRDSGLRFSVTSTLMAMAAPMVMSFLGKRVRDEGMTMTDLGSFLERESGTIRSTLPAGLTDLFWPTSSIAGIVSPVVAQKVEKERSSFRWLPPLAVAALVPGLIWLFSQSPRPTTAQITTTPSGTANRLETDLGDLIQPKLPRSVDLQFDTGSARLRPESQEQLKNLATDLKAYPDVRVEIGGYTDSVGDTGRNLELAQKRANSVLAELVRNGISADRLIAEGHGQQDPIADNSTAEGRALNRRVSVGFTQQ